MFEPPVAGKWSDLTLPWKLAVAFCGVAFLAFWIVFIIFAAITIRTL